jgi:two-component system phosphate regulon sensor histidine kinase PhoR
MLAMNGRILFSSDEFKTGKAKTARSTTDTELLSMVKSDTTMSRTISVNKQRITEIVVPLPEAGGGHVLSMRYLVSNSSLSHRMNAVYGQIAWTVILLLIAVMLITVPYLLTLTHPIILLTGVAEKVQKGDLSARTDIKRKDEIGKLAHTFNDMVTDIQSSREKIELRTKEVQEARARLLASIYSLNLGFIITDKQGAIMMMNSAAIEMVCMLDGGKQAPKSCTIQDINHVLGEFNIEKEIDSCLGQRRTYDYNNVPLDEKFLHIYISPILMGDEAIGAAIVIEDVTEQRIMERSKDEFFSIASHELRTPLTAIRGSTSMIKEFYGDQLKDPDLREMIDDIHESGVRLIQIVNDFLDVSRLEQGKIAFKPTLFNLSELIEGSFKDLDSLSSEKKIALEFSDKEIKSPTVFADRDRSRQVIINIVGNAIKYSEKGTVAVSLSKEKNLVRVTVSDTGRGIAKENQGLLFHKFQQASSSILTRDTSGSTGLGLYISRMMVEGMGGTIQLDQSEAGKGSTFSFTLPLAKPGQKPEPETQQVHGNLEVTHENEPSPVAVGTSVPADNTETIEGESAKPKKVTVKVTSKQV